VRVTSEMPARIARSATVSDLRLLAKRRLPRPLFDFVDGGAGGEATLRDNVRAFADLRLAPRYGIDVGRRSAAANILGVSASMPLVLAPVGFAGVLWPGGEIAAAAVAAGRKLPYCLSTNSNASLEEIAAAAPDGDRWFQLYILKDREWMAGLVRRAANAGFRTLCVTIDLPIAGRRARDIRNGFTLPIRPTLASALDLAARPRWLAGAAFRRMRIGNFEGAATGGFVSIAQHVGSLFDPSADWSVVARLRDAWRGPLVVKGVLHPEDARLALEAGADAIVVSNHGGRQLEDAPASLDALPAVVAAVDGRVPVFVDGGVRRGVDIVKALALGGSACLIGRAYAYGLAAGGRAGVERALDILAAEFDVALALLGVKSPSEIDATRLWRFNGASPP
jgi:isopentenyl diphosphate isomerase/L-lactate dehydrogenase-like FMN-dependent dehydrogenase